MVFYPRLVGIIFIMKSSSNSILILSSGNSIWEKVSGLFDDLKSSDVAASELELYKDEIDSSFNIRKALNYYNVSGVILEINSLSVSQLDKFYSIVHYDDYIPFYLIGDAENLSRIPAYILSSSLGYFDIEDLTDIRMSRLISQSRLRLGLLEKSNRNLKLEKLVSNVSIALSSVIDHDEDIDSSLFESLNLIGEFFSAAEVRVSQINIQEETFEVFTKWKPGITETEKDVQVVESIASYPWLINQIKEGKLVHVNNENEFPSYAENEKREIVNMGYSSFVAIPLLDKKENFGFLTIFFKYPLTDFVENYGELLNRISIFSVTKSVT